MGRAVTWLRCMRAKWKDWLVVVLLGLVLPVTEKSGTARRMEITEQMEPHIKFPFVRSTVPSQAVIAYGILGPTVAVTAHAYCARISPAVHHAATVGSLVSVLLSADITNVFKITVRPALRRDPGGRRKAQLRCAANRKGSLGSHATCPCKCKAAP